MDFYSPEIKLGIELDGDSHFKKAHANMTAERQVLIESIGIKILMTFNLDIYEVLDGVHEAIDGRSSTGERLRRSTRRNFLSSPPYEEGVRFIPPLRRGGLGGVIIPSPMMDQLSIEPSNPPAPPLRKGGNENPAFDTVAPSGPR